MFYVDIYSDLSSSEARRLGNIHNNRVQSLPLSFADKTRQARRLLYEMAGLDPEIDEPPKKNPKHFGHAFLRQIVPEKSMRVTVQNTISFHFLIGHVIKFKGC